MLRILEKIHEGRVMGTQLTATRLRRKVGMSPNRFCHFFNWLQREGYCKVSRTMTRITKRGKAYVVQTKVVDVTELGEISFLKRRTLVKLKETMRALHLARSLAQQRALVIDLVVEAFDLVYRDLYFGGKLDTFEKFRGRFEEHLREHLDKEIGDRIGLVHDAYLVISRSSQDRLLQDAREAMKRGHFLTENHRYALRKLDHIQEKYLVDNNVRWAHRVMATQFSGNETFQGFQHLVDPWQIVERERNEREILQPSKPGMIVFARDGHDANKKWELNIDSLQNRWKQACDKYVGIRACAQVTQDALADQRQ